MSSILKYTIIFLTVRYVQINIFSFYRFVLEPEIQFTTDGDIIGAIAKFTKLPASSLLTQNIHAPENWLVEVVRSIYDLDNIKLDNVAIGVHRYTSFD